MARPRGSVSTYLLPLALLPLLGACTDGLQTPPKWDAQAAVFRVAVEVDETPFVVVDPCGTGEVVAPSPDGSPDPTYSINMTPTPTSTDTPSSTATDGDSDGYSPAQGDCDDGNASVFPGALDIPGDGIDQNCDGSDGDASSPPPQGTDRDDDGYSPTQGDCDDSDGTVYPGAVELCDGLDNDCNTLKDDTIECSLAAHPSLELWLRADDLMTLAEGEAVARWANRATSGAEIVARQLEPDAQPHWRSAGVGGRPSLEFDGLDDLLTLVVPESVPLVQPTVFLVYSLHAGALGSVSYYPFALGGVTDVAGEYLLWETLNKESGDSVDRLDLVSGTNHELSAGLTGISSIDQTRILGVMLGGTLGSGTVWVNGQQAEVGLLGQDVDLAVQLGTDTGAGWTGIGGSAFLSPSRVAAVDVAEVLVFSASPTATELLEIQQYLLTRYGVSMPSSTATRHSQPLRSDLRK